MRHVFLIRRKADEREEHEIGFELFQPRFCLLVTFELVTLPTHHNTSCNPLSLPLSLSLSLSLFLTSIGATQILANAKQTQIRFGAFL